MIIHHWNKEIQINRREMKKHSSNLGFEVRR
jgi:hypothetical protein